MTTTHTGLIQFDEHLYLSYQAVCDCGWSGERHRFEPDALDELSQHYREAYANSTVGHGRDSRAAGQRGGGADSVVEPVAVGWVARVVRKVKGWVRPYRADGVD